MRKIIIFTILINLCLFLMDCGTESNNTTLKISSDVEFEKKGYQDIISSNNQLGFQLLSTAPRDGDGNIFISPTSVFMALSMVCNGADGKTKEEMAKVLGVEGIDTEQLNKANASLMNILYQNSKDVQLNVANSIWLNQNYNFQEEFAQKNKAYFNAEISGIDIFNPQSSKTINDWVKKSTNGKISEMVDTPLYPNLVAILINAIYFKGSWTHEFDKKKTEEKPFYLEDGQTIEVPLMKLDEDLPYFENATFQAVSLPYGEDKKMSMKIFLPKEYVSLKQFEEELINQNWQSWISEFRVKEGTILLPKFKLEYEVGLNGTLQQLGMPNAFEESANFSKMIQESSPLWISKVMQKTFIDVNEEGTEAAAATVVEMATESAEIVDTFIMEVNRPFFITIVDEETGVILFMGSISNPKE